MADVTYQGSGAVSASDFKAVKWIGKTKSGKAVTIEMAKAINTSNIDWTFAEKDDVVASVTFEGVYSNTDQASTDTTEPWSVTLQDGTQAGAAGIMLGAGVFYIGGTAVALTRGGGQFVVEREYREINADGDRGAVEGRVVMESARPKLTMNLLTVLVRLADIYPSVVTVL